MHRCRVTPCPALIKEMTKAELLTEKDTRSDSEDVMKDSAEKRAGDSKYMTDKQGDLADLETGLGDHTDNQKELSTTVQYAGT